MLGILLKNGERLNKSNGVLYRNQLCLAWLLLALKLESFDEHIMRFPILDASHNKHLMLISWHAKITSQLVKSLFY
jgi:hypothetical protein